MDLPVFTQLPRTSRRSFLITVSSCSKLCLLPVSLPPFPSKASNRFCFRRALEHLAFAAWLSVRSCCSSWRGRQQRPGGGPPNDFKFRSLGTGCLGHRMAGMWVLSELRRLRDCRFRAQGFGCSCSAASSS